MPPIKRSAASIADGYETEIARALMPYLYPDWPGRWGWTEATAEMKAECRRQARIVVNGLEPVRPDPDNPANP